MMDLVLRDGAAIGVVFDGPCEVDVARIGAKFGPTGDIFRFLDEHLVELGEEGASEETELMKTSFGAVGKTGIGEGNGDAEATGLGDEVWPDFGFDEDESAGGDFEEEGADDGREVEGAVEDGDTAVLFGGEIGGDSMAGGGGGGKNDGVGSGALEKGGDEFDGDSDFSDADGMEPKALIELGDGGEGGTLRGVQ
jgi:hypothetical protein